MWEPQPPGTLWACNRSMQELLDLSYQSEEQQKRRKYTIDIKCLKVSHSDVYLDL